MSNVLCFFVFARPRDNRTIEPCNRSLAGGGCCKKSSEGTTAKKATNDDVHATYSSVPAAITITPENILLVHVHS